MPLTARLSSRSRLPAAIFVSCVVLIALYLIQAGRQAARIAAAPHLTADDLTAAYHKQSYSTHKQYDHRFIVLTGYVSGFDEGLIGDGAVHMGDVECFPGGPHDSYGMSVVKAMLSLGNDFGHRDSSCAVGQSCTVAGICEGMDTYGMIALSDCRAINH